MFELFLTESFVKEFSKLEPQLRERIKIKLKTTLAEPMFYFERLTGCELFKLRIGKYRIIAQISFSQKQITLLGIGHRKNIYASL